jgi:hypothetical protein
MAHSSWPQTYYRQQIAQGNGHHAAVRSPAAKWIRLVYRCWANHMPYDERIYLDSPATARLGFGSCDPSPPKNWRSLCIFLLTDYLR